MDLEVVLMLKNLIGIHRALQMATVSEYTEEQLNHFRICCITTDELTDGLPENDLQTGMGQPLRNYTWRMER